MPPTSVKELDYEILIPAYRAGGTLYNAIVSAKAQSFAPSAIRVCVDGVDDPENYLTLSTARDSHPSEIIPLETNSGIGTVRQRLLEASRSRYVVFLDSDDELAPFAAEAWIAGLAQAPNASVISYGWRPNGVPIRPRDYKLNRVSHRRLWQKNCLTSSATLIKSNDARNVGGFTHGTRRLVDYELWLKMAAAGMELYASDAPIVSRTVSALSITGAVPEAVQRELELIDTFKPSECSRWEHARRAYLAWLRGTVRSQDYGSSAGNFPPFRDLCANELARFAPGRLLLGPTADRVLAYVRIMYRAGRDGMRR